MKFSLYIFRILWMTIILCLGCLINSCSDKSTEPEYLPPYGPARWYEYPSWSPDGEWIAFTFNKTFPESICVVRPDGSDFNRIIPGSLPSFSPDGQKLAFNSGNDIYVINLQSQEIDRLTSEKGNYFPHWSPNGKRIAYDSNYNDPKGANVLWLMNPDGSNKKDISIHQVGEWRDPYWTPDFRIVFQWAIGGANLFIMDSTGVIVKRLTFEGENRHPSIPNGGNLIVWQRWFEDLNEISIWIMNINGDFKEKLTIGREPCISPDGSKVAFVRE